MLSRFTHGNPVGNVRLGRRLTDEERYAVTAGLTSIEGLIAVSPPRPVRETQEEAYARIFAGVTV